MPPTLPRVLTDQQVHKLLTVGCTSPRDRALVLVILDTGIRLGEVVSIVKDDMGVDTLQVAGKRRKRVVPITQEVRSLLMSLGDDRHPWTNRWTNAP